MSNKELTPAEARLVKHLIELYNLSEKCRWQCDCAKCQAMDEAGNHKVVTFDSLEAKVVAAMKGECQP